MTQTMALDHPQGLLLFLLLLVRSQCKDTSEIQSLVGTLQERVVLPCFISNLTEPNSCYRFRWAKSDGDTSQEKDILAWPKTPKIPDAQRVNWEGAANGQMSLVLTKVQESDAGLYICEICRNWECNIIKKISLIVKPCKVLKAVKAAPNTPVTLKCHDEDTHSELQNISWFRLKGGNPSKVSSDRGKMDGTSLVFQSVHHNDSGWYRCRSEDKPAQSQRCSEINLEVGNDAETTTIPELHVSLTSEIAPKATSEETIGTNVPVIVALVITGLMILAVLISLIVHCRRNTQRAEPQTHTHQSGALMELNNGYEVVNLTASEGTSNSHCNSFYEPLQEENLCTFHY